MLGSVSAVSVGRRTSHAQAILRGQDFSLYLVGALDSSSVIGFLAVGAEVKSVFSPSSFHSFFYYRMARVPVFFFLFFFIMTIVILIDF
jgi:hypothetical protein